jgi:hypothetical protein
LTEDTKNTQEYDETQNCKHGFPLRAGEGFSEYELRGAGQQASPFCRREVEIPRCAGYRRPFTTMVTGDFIWS